jgi:hypothetical protein
VHLTSSFLSVWAARLLPRRIADDEFRHRGNLQSHMGMTATIIDAARKFGCAHRFIATQDDGLMVFVCECCGHRAELLPLHRDSARGQVIAFRQWATAARPSRRRRRVAAGRASGMKP